MSLFRLQNGHVNLMWRISTFSMTDRCLCLPSNDPSPFTKNGSRERIENVLIIGAGLMGSGITQSCAISNAFNYITLHDISLVQLSKARERIEKNLVRLKDPKQGKNVVNDVMSRINVSTNYETSLSARNLLVIEAIPEILQLKQSLFRTINEQLNKSNNLSTVLFVTCSANLPQKDICRHLDAKQNFAGLHFNPEPTMKMVKIIRTADTDARTTAFLQQFVADIKKVCVVSIANFDINAEIK